MQIKLDDEVLLEIDQHMMDLLAHDLLDVVNEIKRRLVWSIQQKCDNCFMRIEKEWLPKLRERPGIDSIPMSKEGFFNLVKSQPNYKNRQQREQEAQKQLNP